MAKNVLVLLWDKPKSFGTYFCNPRNRWVQVVKEMYIFGQ